MSSSTYERLIESAISLFAQKGFYGTSIRDISEQLGISKQALLHHFASKEKLYGEVLERIAQRVISRVKQANENLTAIEQLEISLDQMSVWSTEDLDGARVLMRELLDNPERAPNAVNWYLNPLLDAMVSIIEKGMKQGEFKTVRPLAFIYNILGAQHYFIISLPTLKQMLSAKEYKKLLKDHISKKLICTNPDLTVHRGNIEELCAGSVAKVFEKLGGQVIYFGKPYEEVYKMCFSKNEKVLAIGDNLRTDIKGANVLNFDCVYISEGVHRNEYNETSELEMLLKKYNVKANFYQKELKW